MKIPKFESVTQGVIKVMKRFPYSMLAALVGTISAVTFIYLGNTVEQSLLYRLLMTSILGFLLFTIAQVWQEREDSKAKKQHFLQAGIALLLVLYFWLLPSDFRAASEAFMLRFMILLVSLLFLSAFVPFIKNLNESNGFWQYIKTLFVRFFLTFIFTGSLYLGLVLALVAANQLLGFDFAGKIFSEIWVVVAGLISTTFFLLGVPEKTAELEKKTDYHRGIKVFAQYILIPLLLIYALILYIYIGKIIIHWSWPDGMVSWLIIVFSAGTILANFLLLPLIKKEKWVAIFTRISFALMIPMTMVMALAMKIRIDDYGVTEMRYYGIALCIWFLMVAIYFVFSKKRNYIYLPISLFIIAVLSSVGPLSSMSLSEWSQLGRLNSALTQNGLLVDGKIERTVKELPQEDFFAIQGTLNYLINIHGYSVIQPWFKEDLTAIKPPLKCYESECVAALLGVASRMEGIDQSYRSYYVDETELLNIGGYKQFLPFNFYSWQSGGDMKFDGGGCQIILHQKTQQIEVITADNKKEMLDLRPLIEKLKQSSIEKQSWNEMRIDSKKIGIVFLSFTFHLKASGEVDRIEPGNGFLLIK